MRNVTNAWRLQPLMAGMLFARGRLTVSSWLRAGQLSDDYQDYYYFLGSLGRKVNWLAALLLHVQRFHPARSVRLLALVGVPMIPVVFFVMMLWQAGKI